MATDPKPAADALAEPFRHIGEPHAGHDADLIDLDDENTLWLVEGGAVDVFVVEVEQGLVAAPLKHLLRVESGELLFGVEPAAGGGLHLKAKRTPGALLHRASRGPWLEDVAELVARRVDVWVEKLSHAIARDVPHDGRPGQLLRRGESAQIAAGTILSSRRGVVWVSAPGQVLFLDAQQQSAEDVPGLTPVSTATRLTMLDEGRVEGRSAGALMREGRLFAALAEFHRLVLETERLSRVLATVDTANQQTERAALRRREAERAHAELARVADPAAAGRAGTHPDSALTAALDAVGAHEGIEFRRPGRSRGEPERPHSLQDVLVASAVRARRVRLSPEDRWWRSDSGALLGFRAGDGQPVALLPGRLGRYRMVAPDGASTRLNAERAAALAPGAWSFVAPLPQRTAARDVARVMARNMAPEVMRFLAGGLLAGMLSLAPAFVIRALFDRILPSHDTGLLLGAATVLVLLAFTGLLLTLFQSTALLRAEGRTTARATAAVWDRLIGSRIGDLQGFAAGDLGQRALVFQTLREQAAGVAAHTLLSIVFLAPTFALLFVFNAAIGWASLVSGTVGLGIVAAFGVAQIGPQRRMLVAQQSLSGRPARLPRRHRQGTHDGGGGGGFRVLGTSLRRPETRRDGCAQAERVGDRADGEPAHLHQRAVLRGGGVARRRPGRRRLRSRLCRRHGVLRLGASPGDGDRDHRRRRSSLSAGRSDTRRLAGGRGRRRLPGTARGAAIRPCLVPGPGDRRDGARRRLDPCPPGASSSPSSGSRERARAPCCGWPWPSRSRPPAPCTTTPTT